MAASQARESCENVLELILPWALCCASFLFPEHSGVDVSALILVQIANWSAERVSDSYKVMWHLNGRPRT